MLPDFKNIARIKLQKALLILSVVALTGTAYGVSGINSNIDKEKKSQKSAMTSLRESISKNKGVQFNGHSKVNADPQGKGMTLNNLMTIKKGSMTFVMPLKTKVPGMIKVGAHPIQPIR
jgi:hypothetical protein